MDIFGYTFYHITHSDNKAHGGFLILRSSIRYEIGKYQREFLQAANIVIEDWKAYIIISAMYSLSKYIMKSEEYMIFLKTLVINFIATGDYNAKYTQWRLRLILPKEWELFKVIEDMNLTIVSAGNSLSDDKRIFWTSRI